MYTHDKRIVITLDAGGTNFVFSAMQSGRMVVEPLSVPSNAADLDRCLQTLTNGFTTIIGQLKERPVAISFAFPGPADYPNGIIGGYLPNFPSFRDGVALGAYLEDQFGIPVFINNDGDLFAYGEALCGALPTVNEQLRAAGSNKHYHNLLGYTFGTGFGFGLVTEDTRLHVGDNSCAETWCLRHKKRPEIIVEEGVAVRAVKRVYGEISGDTHHTLTPKEIFDIAEGKCAGDRAAAIKAFEEMGEIAGDAMATAVTLMDGLIVIGGGITAAHKYFMPTLLRELRSQLGTLSGEQIDRVQMKVYDLDNEAEFAEFARGEQRKLKVYGTDKCVVYDPQKRVGVCISKLGADRAISAGAYAFALNKLDENKK
ncbi:MAG: ROK family protein [Alistipes sp.]